MTDETNGDAYAASEHSDVELVSAERLVFFSDAVVAIAITLLALVLPVPHGANSRALLKDMWHDRDAYLAFLISFIVIANHWRSHHRLYRNVVKLDSTIISINMFWLLLIVITPFATRLIAANGAFGARFSVYAIIQVLTILAFLTMSRHIRRGHLLRHGAPPPTSRVDDAAYLAVACTFAVSIPVAVVYQTDWAFAIWVASVFTARAVRRLSTRAPSPGHVGGRRGSMGKGEAR
jgi:TMEM175 potassium channel family protein